MHAARGLLGKDADGSSDPYVELKFNGARRRTSVRRKTLEPVWNESFSFAPAASVDLSLELWDEVRVPAADAVPSTMSFAAIKLMARIRMAYIVMASVVMAFLTVPIQLWAT